MKRNVRRFAVPGALATVAGLLLAVVAVPPGAWAISIGQWADTIRPYAPYAIGAIAGFIAGALFVPKRRSRSTLRVLEEKEFIREVRADINSRRYSIVKVFGYTGEVVGNDIIQYEDRYRSDLEVRFLHRDWIVEARDEEGHNEKAGRKGRRLWDKSRAIRTTGTSEWTHPLRRSIRYYVHQPILKAVLLCDETGKALVAYFSFQKWDPDPGEGGSQFKSVPTTMGVAVATDGPWQAQLVDRLNSQFEYEWQHGKTALDLIEFENSTTDKTKSKSRIRSDKI